MNHKKVSVLLFTSKHIYMKIRILPIIALLYLAGCTKNKHTEVKMSQAEADSLLRQETGADNYGMKVYVMAFLKRGPNRPNDSAHAAELQKAHLQNIGRMANSGELIVAGPFLDNDSLRGLNIFDVRSIEEAKTLTESDPAIQFGSLKMELKLWYGSAALVKMNEIHRRIAKENP
jgi:uncharacterized protein YciI